MNGTAGGGGATTTEEEKEVQEWGVEKGYLDVVVAPTPRSSFIPRPGAVVALAGALMRGRGRGSVAR
jgi:hypothetical protein